jgi:hypothetical protein
VISFRYHVFTIVAIFLAVALGIAVGNAYVQPALVDQLRNQTDDLRVSLEQYRADVRRYETTTNQLISVGNILPVLDRHRLVGTPVVVVTQDGTDPAVLSQTASALGEAQADLVAVFAVTDRMLPTDGKRDPQLAELVGLPATASPSEVAARAADTLAERLVVGPPRRGAQAGGGDVLDALLRGQYLRFVRGYPKVSEGGLNDIGGRGEFVVVLSGSDEGLAMPPEAFAVPLVESLVRRGVTVAAGESAASVDSFVDALRGNADLGASRLVTVDDLGWPIGGAALVLGLERVVVSGDGGDYGVRGNADAPIPPLP